MKLKNISLRNFLTALVGGFILITVSLFGVVGSVHAVDFGVSFSPTADAVVQDPAINPTISFDRAVYADDEGTVFTSTTLADVVSLHTTNTDGTSIPFSASINSDNTIITLVPTDPLVDGAVHIGISNRYYDRASAQGDAASAVFFVAAVSVDTPPATPPADTTAPTVTITPADGATVTDAGTDITLAFDEAIYQNTDGTVFDSAALANLVAVKVTDANGADIERTTSINAENTVVTIDLTSDLADTSTVYIALTDGYYDAADNQGATATSSFTVALPAPEEPADTTAPTVTITPADGATVTDAGTDITLAFDEAIYQNTDRYGV